MAKRRGKYAGIVDTLPKHPLIEPERAEVVDAVQAKILAPPDPEWSANTIDINATMKEVEDRVHRINEYIVRGAQGRRWASEFAKWYVETRHVRDRLTRLDDILSVTQEAYTVLMVEQMEVEGTSSLRLADGQPISTYPEPYSQVVDRDAFREWCIKQGLLRQMQLAWQTTNMLVKKMLIAGEPEPPGISVTAKTKVRLGPGDD